MACSGTYFAISKIMNSSHRMPRERFLHCRWSNYDFRDRSGKKDVKNLKLTSRFTSLREALGWEWNIKAKREAKEINPYLVFTLVGT